MVPYAKANESRHCQLKPGDWSYLAEGAANLILKSSLDKYAGKLLRVRKYVPGSPSTVQVDAFYKKHVIPVLKDIYVKSELVELAPGFVKSINERAPARNQRNDAPLDETETHAFLMESAFDSNLKIESKKIKGSTLTLCRDEEGSIKEVVVEFKPKWLLTSPNSGEHSRRCRTCALAYMRGKNPGICPLDLVSSDYNIVQEAFKHHLKGSEEYVPNIPLAEIMSKTLFQAEVFDKLTQLQTLDSRGILWYDDKEELDEDFLVATAARDCTMFVSIRKGSIALKPTDKVVEVGESYVVGVKLADIDLKNPSKAKREYWAGIERSLIKEEWYYKNNLPSCRALSSNE